MRYIAVDRDALRPLLFDDGPLGDLLLSTFIAAARAAAAARGRRPRDRRPALVGPHAPDRRVRAAQPAPVHLARPRARHDRDAAALIDGARTPSELPLVRLPGGTELRGPSNGELSRALGIGLELAPREEVDLLIVGGGPAGLGAAVYGASEGLDTLVVESTALGGQAGTSRRIENYLGFPAGISGTRTDEPRGHPGAQVRRPDRDAVPRARARAGQRTATSCGSRTATRSPRAPSCSPPAPSTGACRSTASTTTRA